MIILRIVQRGSKLALSVYPGTSPARLKWDIYVQYVTLKVFRVKISPTNMDAYWNVMFHKNYGCITYHSVL